MKKQTFIVIAVVLLIAGVVCYNLIAEHKQKNKHSQAVKQIEESTQTTEQEDKYPQKEEISSDKKNWDEMTAEEQEAIRNKYLSKFNFNQKYTLKAINDEFSVLFDDLHNTDYDDGFCMNIIQPILHERLEIYLKNSTTFYSEFPLIKDDDINILKTPDGNCKLYGFGIQDGNITNYANYIQYIDKSGKVAFSQLNGDGYCNKLWKFTSKGKICYAGTMYYKNWIHLEVFNMSDETLTYLYPKDGESDTVETYYFNDIDITFNTATKIFSIVE